MRRGKVKEWRKVRQFRVTLRFYDPQIANKEREERKLVGERLEKLGDIRAKKMESERRYFKYLICIIKKNTPLRGKVCV